jgi:hypothetical protein
MITTNAGFDWTEEQTAEAIQKSDEIELSLSELDMVGGGGITHVFG